MLEIRGRKSGRLISFPVAIAEHDGERYLVAMLGEKTNWALNARAGDGRAVLRHGRREEIRLTEELSDRRAAILRRYLQVAPGARPHFPIDRHAALEEFERIVDRYPVFRITSPRIDPLPPRRDAGPDRAVQANPRPPDPNSEQASAGGEGGHRRLGRGHPPAAVGDEPGQARRVRTIQDAGARPVLTAGRRPVRASAAGPAVLPNRYALRP
ncbi:nitroreductase/quinone reductase family protein [Nonomuraea muscovyensis]